ncbi:MAG: hypothetical protein WB630_04550 [Candidatus Acidiferrales bacterium]
MLSLKLIVVPAFLLGLAASPICAQEASKSQTDQSSAPAQAVPEAPAAKTTDVASPDAIMAATYDVISGPAGQQRDWARFRSLFVADARLIAVGPKKTGTGFEIHGVSPDGYQKFGDPYFQKNGFYEREIARKSERYGNIMHIFSTYESRHDAKDPQPFARGINSFQLFYDGTRWWVVTIYWQEESRDVPLPQEYLPAGRQ